MNAVARKVVTFGVALVFSVIAVAQVPVNGVSGAKLKDLVGTPAYVTVVLKAGVKDVNLRIRDIGPTYVAVTTNDGTKTAFSFESIAEIVVQYGKIESAPDFRHPKDRALTVEEQQLFDRAIERARQHFDASNTDRALRMDAAAILLLSRDKVAQEYLEQLLTGNDVSTAVEAGMALYLGGQPPRNAKAVVERGMGSGDQSVRVKAFVLAGLLGIHARDDKLSELVRGRLSDDSVPEAANEQPLPKEQISMEPNPEIALTFAICLARNGDGDGIRALNQQMEKPYNKEAREDLLTRADMAIALVLGGEHNGIAAVQELLSSPDVVVIKHTCDLIAEAGLRRLMTITQSSVEHSDPHVALAACMAAASCGNASFHDRLAGARLARR